MLFYAEMLLVWQQDQQLQPAQTETCCKGYVVFATGDRDCKTWAVLGERETLLRVSKAMENSRA